MKTLILCLFSAALLESCHSPTACDFVWGAGAAISRVATFQLGPTSVWNQVDTSKVYAALSLSRRQDFNGDPTGYVSTRVAFENGTDPIQAGDVSVNGMSVPWYDCSSQTEQADTYSKTDSLLYGSEDSVTLSYSNFEGESATLEAPVAQKFGAFTFENNSHSIDTISASKGYTLRYEHPIPGDSLLVNVNLIDSANHVLPFFVMPDTGAITFAPHQLPYDSEVARMGYVVEVYRVRWAEAKTPSNKRVGFISFYEADCLFRAKP